MDKLIWVASQNKRDHNCRKSIYLNQESIDKINNVSFCTFTESNSRENIRLYVERNSVLPYNTPTS